MISEWQYRQLYNPYAVHVPECARLTRISYRAKMGSPYFYEVLPVFLAFGMACENRIELRHSIVKLHMGIPCSTRK